MALLIMFMSLPSGTRHKSVDLVLARFAVAQPNALREDVIKITLTRDGSVFFGYIQVHSDEIAKIIEGRVKAGAERKVYLAVDARSRYGDVKPVLDQVRYAGIRQICILAERQSK